MKKYIVNNAIVYQRDYRIPSNMSILDYVLKDKADPDIKNGDATVLIISLNEEVYEVNLVGAIIFEMLVAGRLEDDIYDELIGKFNVKEEELKTAIKSFINSMLRFNVVQEEI